MDIALLSDTVSLATSPTNGQSNTYPQKRRSFSGGDDSEEDGRGDGVFGGACDDGLFGGGGYGGRRWNSDGFGGQNWDESLRWSSNDLAFNFVFEVIYWSALSNCVHFTFKKKCLEELSATELGSKVPIALMSCHLGAYFMSILMHRN
ncbi:uncharacterized protein LOC123211592 [Mangifera indica]|uniref:uncharacterized protein LOC123211592 n=1 Tax=Mangifera indica TaxID=29780 RepID=UPI001CFA024A|nr:uncharacterized protein LOC123211592 [Mangifera indica]